MTGLRDRIVSASVVDLHPTEPTSPEFSDDALTLRFTKRHKDDLRYIDFWHCWWIWNCQRWTHDDTINVVNLVRANCREASEECEDLREAKKIASAKTVAAVERLARSDRKHAARVDQWDTDPWKLNTPGGTVDLRTGNIRAHRREDYCTKMTAVSPGRDCSKWIEFLKAITNGDDELQNFLRRVAGYCLTGLTREHAFFFVYGTGANGKSVFLNTLAGALGDYHTTAPMETFIASHTDRHPTELAALRGARLVTATEIEEGRWWAEAKIKALTGGDPVSARFMRQDFFEFSPQFKLIIAGNHKPRLRNINEAIRRRLYLIPFNFTVSPEIRDERLAEKLREEWPGVLAWAIEGAVEWAKTGLQPPEAVRAATEEYVSAEDAISQWIEERTVRGAEYETLLNVLYVDWKSWADKTGEFAGSRRRFSQALKERGYKTGRQGGTGRTLLRGLALANAGERFRTQ